jgi:hypothetical protein
MHSTDSLFSNQDCLIFTRDTTKPAFKLKVVSLFLPRLVRALRPSRTTQYEIGFTQMIAEFLSFDITMYYKDVKDQVVFISQDTQILTLHFNLTAHLQTETLQQQKVLSLTFTI